MDAAGTFVDIERLTVEIGDEFSCPDRVDANQSASAVIAISIPIEGQFESTATDQSRALFAVK